MSGKTVIVAIVMGLVAVGSVVAYNAYFSSATATCGLSMTLASYKFTSDTTLSANLCRVGTAETLASYQVATTSGIIVPSDGNRTQSTPIGSTPTTIQVRLTSGYTFQSGSSYFLYINTNVGTHKFTVTR